MTIQKFKENYYCRFYTFDKGTSKSVMLTELVERENNKLVHTVNTEFDVIDIDMKIRDSQHQNSINQIDWDTIIDKTKRAQLDHMMMICGVQKFYPMNGETPIDDLYDN